MLNSNQLLRSFIAQTLLENIDHEEEIMDDFLQSDMYKKISSLIENSQSRLLESKDSKNVINSSLQVSRVHKSLSEYFNQDDITSQAEMIKRQEALQQLRRASNNKDFHEREKNIHNFLSMLGIALEATPFLFILIYLFNTDNPALQEWCSTVGGITMAEGFIAFMSMFLFGEKLRSTQKKKAGFHDKAAEFYAGEEKDEREKIKKYLSKNDRFKLKDDI